MSPTHYFVDAETGEPVGYVVNRGATSWYHRACAREAGLPWSPECTSDPRFVEPGHWSCEVCGFRGLALQVDALPPEVGQSPHFL